MGVIKGNRGLLTNPNDLQSVLDLTIASPGCEKSELLAVHHAIATPSGDAILDSQSEIVCPEGVTTSK